MKIKKPKNNHPFDKLVNWSETKLISINISPSSNVYANIMIQKVRFWSIIKPYQKPKNI